MIVVEKFSSFSPLEIFIHGFLTVSSLGQQLEDFLLFFGLGHHLVSSLELFPAWLGFSALGGSRVPLPNAALSWWANGKICVILAKMNLSSLSERSICIQANAQSCGECIQVSEMCGWCTDEVSWITKLFYHTSETYMNAWMWCAHPTSSLSSPELRD